jgi:hypothetical protein
MECATFATGTGDTMESTGGTGITDGEGRMETRIMRYRPRAQLLNCAEA